MTKRSKLQDKASRQVIDKGVDGARHMVDNLAQDARQRDFRNKAYVPDLLWT